jgi:hypothetical protein
MGFHAVGREEVFGRWKVEDASRDVQRMSCPPSHLGPAVRGRSKQTAQRMLGLPHSAGFSLGRLYWLSTESVAVESDSAGTGGHHSGAEVCSPPSWGGSADVVSAGMTTPLAPSRRKRFHCARLAAPGLDPLYMSETNSVPSGRPR